MPQDIYAGLCRCAGAGQVFVNEPMSRHTTFRIGGPADYFVSPVNLPTILATVDFCRKNAIPFSILGNGSNLLVADKGYRGVIIQIDKNYSEICTDGEEIIACAGALLSSVARQALDHGLTGFEFASGIPGTLGGAVVMNAGAYGGEIKDVLKEALVLTPEGQIKTYSCRRLKFGYRTSEAAKKDLIVLEVVLTLTRGVKEEIRDRMEDLKRQRMLKQPLDVPSAGSTFKRPPGYYAGKLIMEAGLKGFRVGGAQVSEKHCGFVVNTGGASAEDVRNLMRQVTKRVQECSGVTLEPELKMLGEFEDEL